MKRLSKEKRNQLLIATVSTVGALAIIYFFLIQSQTSRIANIKRSQASAETKLADMEKAIKRSDAVTTELSEAVYNLQRAEADVASGDIYAWVYDFMRRFKSSYRVEIPSVSAPSVGPVDLLPAFPYRQIRIPINGTAYYHDLGKFVSDLENNFPHMRVVNLSLDPAGGGDNEKLNFHADIIALAKPTP